ncbi:uncharacterized protein LOC135463552 isoform X1 [Liolophura sinensis]|uniref:uncharacterized protein LOC135463552 isoform X1 n=1 Tax=Liolophura sinensis TaxID=3198878 RepID=UPI0031584A54
MGVTLERVQNKFACIIGELCSEPLVLSQFAVWVDLRIAEYKTKGTISLDCSGESPNPGWMRGVKNHPPRTVDTGQGAHRRRGSFASSPSIHMSPAASPLANQMYSERLQSSDSPRMSHNSGQQQSFPSRLSPDIVVIKNEPSPEQQTSCAFSRKRTADSSELQSDFYSTAKSRRVGGSSTLSSSAQESSSNQSLMSIINTESDSISLEPVDSSEADIFKVTMDAQDDQNQGLSGSPSNSTFSPRRLAASATTSSGSPNNQSWMGSTGDAAQGSSSQTGVSMWGYRTEAVGTKRADPKGKPGIQRVALKIDKMSVGMRRQRIVDREKKSASTIKHQLAALLQIEGWLREAPRHETRNVEDIPPLELDEYLTEYFLSGKKCNGLEFRATYFSRLRTNIERHLKEHGYPHSIVKSPLFIRSQEAFKIRYTSLTSSLEDPLSHRLIKPYPLKFDETLSISPDGQLSYGQVIPNVQNQEDFGSESPEEHDAHGHEEPLSPPGEEPLSPSCEEPISPSRERSRSPNPEKSNSPKVEKAFSPSPLSTNPSKLSSPKKEELSPEGPLALTCTSE